MIHLKTEEEVNNNLTQLPDCLASFVGYFKDLTQSDISLDRFYDQNIDFVDPIHRIKGLPSMSSYFDQLNSNLASGGFSIHDVQVTNSTAHMQWVMNVQLKKPRKRVQADGISVLRFDNKITSHRDYFDASQMFYEEIPILGSVIRMIKRKVAGSEFSKA